MKSYVKHYHNWILNMSPEEAKIFNDKKFGFSGIDLIPVGIMLNAILDILQLFIPKLRLK